MKKILITFLVCFISSYSFSQEDETRTRKHAIGIGVGSGFSADYSLQLSKKIALTAKYAALDHFEEDYEYKLDKKEVLVDADFDFQHADLLLSFGGSLRFVVGAGYFMSNQLDLDIEFTETISIGDVEFSSDDIGNLSINSTWDQILPYAGLGFGRAVPKTGFNIGLEIGAFYDADGPEIALDATGIIQDTKDQEGLLQEVFKKNKFLPNLNLRLAFSF